MKRAAQDSANQIQATTDSKEYKIMMAAQNGDMAQVRALAEAGANLNAVSALVQPPLMKAAARGDIPMATYLVSKGAQLSVTVDKHTHSALMSAVYPEEGRDNSAMIRFLVSKGADINAQQGAEGAPTSSPYAERAAKMKSDTALMAAVQQDHVAHVRTLLALHANPNLYSNNRRPLKAARQDGGAHKAEVIQLLTAAGALE
jgi:ankyrin repeat protein